MAVHVNESGTIKTTATSGFAKIKCTSAVDGGASNDKPSTTSLSFSDFTPVCAILISIPFYGTSNGGTGGGYICGFKGATCTVGSTTSVSAVISKVSGINATATIRITSFTSSSISLSGSRAYNTSLVTGSSHYGFAIVFGY